MPTRLPKLTKDIITMTHYDTKFGIEINKEK